jgi:hypothetical protein
VPYKKAYRAERTALSKRWNKTPSSIGAPVSKLYVTSFGGSAAKLIVRGLFVEVIRSHTVRHRQTG